MPDYPETIAAIATAPGKSGIGIVRISGPKSLQIATSITGIRPKPRQVHFIPFKNKEQQVLDKGLVIYFKSPDSYTGEDVVELQGHGSQVILNMILKEAFSLGAVPADPGEFTQRAYLNGKLDLIQAESVADLIESTSEKSAIYAMQSLVGEFSARIKSIIDKVTTIRVYVEGSLDFPEEEIDFLDNENVPNNIMQAIKELDTLLKSAAAGKKLRQGMNVVIMGRANVGKSSLLNLLVGTNKSIVTHHAGTTRDVIEDTIYVAGVAITLIDTAGIREPENIIEKEGIRRSQKQIKNADVLLLVTDGPEITRKELQMLDQQEKKHLIIIHNKIDLYGHKAVDEQIEGVQHIYLSVKNKEGVESLKLALKNIILVNNDSENLVYARERHIQLLTKAKRALEQGLKEFETSRQGEILADFLKTTQELLGQITGEFHSDDLLGEIFSRFCIGK
jgi:tRNA modification GTPase